MIQVVLCVESLNTQKKNNVGLLWASLLKVKKGKGRSITMARVKCGIEEEDQIEDEEEWLQMFTLRVKLEVLPA